MTLQHYIEFLPDREALDGRGWHYSYWDSALLPTPLVIEEYCYRLDRPTGGAASATKVINNKALTSNVATLTTTTAHGYVVGDIVTVALAPADPAFDGSYTITVVGSSTTFSYAKTNANVGTVAAAGSVVSAPCVFERVKATASADTNVRAYFTTKAQNTVLATNAATVSSTRDASLTAEGLTP